MQWESFVKYEIEYDPRYVPRGGGGALPDLPRRRQGGMGAEAQVAQGQPVQVGRALRHAGPPEGRARPVPPS